ncbi:MAG: putative zinc-binding protein [Woeseiaceae bacterium]|nr:putative zinc-binding protein [Woeseiaceae bacterium]
MNTSTSDFSLKVSAVKGACPAGEVYAQDNIAEKAIPVLSCEGPCIRGEIARLAANMVGEEAPYARCCYAETLLVPHSAMATWVRQAEKVVMIDGCFLSCIGRALENVIDERRMIHIDALPLYRKYSDVFLYTDVPEKARKELAREVADKILERLNAEQETAH